MTRSIPIEEFEDLRAKVISQVLQADKKSGDYATVISDLFTRFAKRFNLGLEKEPTLQPSQPFTSDIRQYWNTDFPEGPQEIYMLQYLSDNTTEPNLEKYTPKEYFIQGDSNKPLKYKFKNWREFAEYILEDKSRFDWCLVNCSYDDDEEDWFNKIVESLETPLSVIELIINLNNLDPLFLVRKNNDLLQWMLVTVLKDD